MNFPFDTERRDAWVSHMRKMSVESFETPPDKESDVALPVLFGSTTTIRPVAHCDDLSGEVPGCTALVVLPAEVGGGVAGLYFNELSNGRRWSQMSFGRRIDTTLRLTRKARVHAGLPSLCVALAHKVAGVLADVPEEEAASVSLNDWPDAWLLRHGIDLLCGSERSTWETMMALAVGADSWQRIQMLLERADRLIENLPFDDELEDVIRDAALLHGGVTLTSRQIESLCMAEGLLGSVRAQWPQVARDLIARRYADGLSADYHAAPTPKVTGSAAVSSGVGAGPILAA